MDYYHQFSHYLEIEEGRGERTIRAYVEDVRRFRRWLDENALEAGVAPEWNEVTESHVRGYTGWLGSERSVRLDNGKTRRLRKAGPRYIHRVISGLRMWFDFLKEIEKVVESNPARQLKKPKIPKRLPDSLNAEEIALLVRTALEESRRSERTRDWTLIAFLYNTGLRVSELCAMRLGDIAYRDGLPYVLTVIGKGNKQRKVALSAEAARALNQWLKHRRQLVMDLPPGADTEFIWLNPVGRSQGKAIKPNGVLKLLYRVGNKARISKRVHPHKLRHSFATQAVKNGAKLNPLKEMLGHASIATTGIYLHADESELESVASVIPPVVDSAGRQTEI